MMGKQAPGNTQDGQPSSFVDAAWMQRGLDALREAFDTNAALKSQMVQFLFDAGFWDANRLHWDAAITRFNQCMNPSRSDVNFKLAEVWALTKRFRRYALFFAMCDDLGFERPRQIPTEARHQQLLERTADAIEALAENLAYVRGEFERLGVPDPTTRIHPGLREGGSFSVDEICAKVF